MKGPIYYHLQWSYERVSTETGGVSNPLRWYKVKNSVHLQSIPLMHVQIQMFLRGAQTNTELTGLTGVWNIDQSEKSGSTRNVHPKAGREYHREDTFRGVLNMWSSCLKPPMQCGTHSSLID
jgi:hypothetical protein